MTSAHGAEWVKTSAALERLGCCERSYAVLNGLESRRIQPAFGAPVSVYRLADLDRARKLMTEAQLSARAAVRVVIAQNEGRL